MAGVSVAYAEACVSLGVQGFTGGQLRSYPPAWHVPELQTPRRKAGVGLSRRHFRRSLPEELRRASSPSGEAATLGESGFSDEAFLRAAVPGLLWELLPAPRGHQLT